MDASRDPRWSAAGPVGAPLVVLIHPTRMNRAFWTPQVEALTPANRVVSLDLPGHGWLAAEPFSLAAAVAVVRAAVESERGPLGTPSTTPTVLVGLSLGGYVAMAAAAESPSLADVLVLAGATAEPTGGRARPFRVLALAFDRAD
ncbi:MAG: alpha/beta fold hydrolase, partial [Candidatus Limnocylindrales bacterium]